MSSQSIVSSSSQDVRKNSDLSELQRTYPELYEAIFVHKRNILISGPGGTGKSYALRLIKKEADQLDISCSLTSTTGVSAYAIGGQTIHRWASIGIADKPAEVLVQKLKKKPENLKRWKDAVILIIDEVSMLGNKTITLLDKVGKQVRLGRKRLAESKTISPPFGGVQIIMSGDFCFAGDTEIMLHTGNIKLAKNIEEGDMLMGDDGTSRHVTRLCRGHSTMYKVNIFGGESFTVTGNHILCLRARRHGHITWNERTESWFVQFWNNNVRKIEHKRFSIREKNSQEVEQEAIQFANSLPQDLIVEMSVNDYLNLNTSARRELVCYRTGITWPEKETLIHPWLLGAWLGDGNTNFDQECIAEFDKLLSAMKSRIKSVANPGRYVIKNLEDKVRSPFKSMLIKYNLMDNKHIPGEYMHNSRRVRLELLAGLIDIDGHLLPGEHTFQIFLVRESLAREICYLARSLGFSCFLKKCGQDCISNPKKKFSSVSWRICIGGNIHEIPCRIFRKQSPILTSKHYNSLWMNPTIENIGEDDFYGFETDGNKRFLLGDFTVSHNCQLPPIDDEYAFNASVWKDMNLYYYRMVYPYRYPDLKHFELLSRIRTEEYTKGDILALQSRVKAYDDYRKNGSKDLIKPTRIYPLKKDVDNINLAEIEKLEGDMLVYEAEDNIIVKIKEDGKPVIDVNNLNTAEYSEYMDTIVSPEVYIKVGAQVMLTRNLDVELGLVNGARGVALECDEERISVKFRNGMTVDIVGYVYEHEDDKVIVRRTQIPLQLAWSISIHKSQGSTLDYAIIDLGTSLFAAGQGYVALSRVKTLDGVYIINVIPEKLRADPEALKFEQYIAANSVLAKSIDSSTESEGIIADSLVEPVKNISLSKNEIEGQ